MKKKILLLLISLFLWVELCPSASAEDVSPLTAAREHAKRLADTYGVQIRIFAGLDMEQVDAYLVDSLLAGASPLQEMMASSRADAALSALEKALFACPPTLLGIFGDGLVFALAGEISFTDNGDKVSGFLYLEEDSTFLMILDADDVTPAYFFHELWHAAEIRTGVVFDGWETLNPEGFQYTWDYHNRVGFDPEWFYRSYGVVSAVEDRATVFEAYIAESSEWWEAHPRIRRKLEAMLEAVPFAARE